MEISVPRDRESSFEPKIVAKRQRRLGGVAITDRVMEGLADWQCRPLDPCQQLRRFFEQ